jgi:hypothetical protein
MITFVIGLLIGGFLGVVLTAVLTMNKDEDEYAVRRT